MVSKTCQASGLGQGRPRSARLPPTPSRTTVVDGDDAPSAAGIPIAALSCALVPLRSPLQPHRFPARAAAVGTCSCVRTPSLLPTARRRQLLLSAGNASQTPFIHSSVKPPAEMKLAAGSLGFAALDFSELCPALAVYSLPVFIPCISQSIPSSAQRRFPPARASRCCGECEPGRQQRAEPGACCQLLGGDVPLPRAGAVGFEWH